MKFVLLACLSADCRNDFARPAARLELSRIHQARDLAEMVGRIFQSAGLTAEA